MPAGVFEEIAQHTPQHPSVPAQANPLPGHGRIRPGSLFRHQVQQIHLARHGGTTGLQTTGQKQLPDQIVEFDPIARHPGAQFRPLRSGQQFKGQAQAPQRRVQLM